LRVGKGEGQERRASKQASRKSKQEERARNRKQRKQASKEEAKQRKEASEPDARRTMRELCLPLMLLLAKARR
jgi:hypothetical protein